MARISTVISTVLKSRGMVHSFPNGEEELPNSISSVEFPENFSRKFSNIVISIHDAETLRRLPHFPGGPCPIWGIHATFGRRKIWSIEPVVTVTTGPMDQILREHGLCFHLSIFRYYPRIDEGSLETGRSMRVKHLPMPPWRSLEEASFQVQLPRWDRIAGNMETNHIYIEEVTPSLMERIGCPFPRLKQLSIPSDEELSHWPDELDSCGRALRLLGELELELLEWNYYDEGGQNKTAQFHPKL
ncbi:hypothetical protein JB92DRAFT_2824622 [Gautieria morchelliformis]|nr:hypothetical protein JB92DRAFT_2824622 [Gautieria morchelliformis]